jgi:Ca2+-binding EF-hand superfamily protein
MTKKDMLKCYKDLSTCDMDKVEHVVNAIYQTFDTDNDGKVGMRKQIDDVFCLMFYVLIDFKEFVIGFLLTTKGTMEEKLDYTFQLYDIDKDGYIDQSEIDVMAKVFEIKTIFLILSFVYL